MRDHAVQHVRSTFVTVVAWVFIVVSALVAAFWTLILAMSLAVPTDDGPGTTGLSLMVAVPLAVVAVSAGLLTRKRWARIAFVLILVALMAWSAMTAIGVWMMSQDWEESMTTFSVLTASAGLVLATLFAYLAWRLSTGAVASEFQR